MSTSALRNRRRTTTAVVAAAAAVSAVGLLSAPAHASATATKTFSKSFTDVCAIPPFGSQSLPARVAGAVPTTVVHGTAFRLSAAKVSVTVPATLSQAAYNAGARSGVVVFSQINITSSNTTKAVTNAVPTPVSSARIPIPASGTVTFVVPPSGVTSVPFTASAGSAGKTITFKVGTVAASLTLYRADGSTVVNNQTVSCAAPSPVVVLTSVPVS